MLASGLLLDDSKPQLLACRDVLKFWGIEADLATTAGEAERRAESQEYGVALLDFAVAGLPGGPRGLIQKLRAKSPGCKIFILTAYPDEASRTLADLNIPVLEKPLDWETFKKRLEPLTQQRLSRSEGRKADL